MTIDGRAARQDELLAQMDWARALARRLARDADEADELAQSALATALARPARLEAEAGALRAWLARVMRNAERQLARAEARRGTRERAAARAEAQPATDDVVARGELHRRLVEAVMELDEPYRTTILRRYLDGERTARIAVLEGVTPAAVRKRLSRALGVLRARLERDFEGGRGAWCAALYAFAERGGPTAGVAARAASWITAGALMATSWNVAALGAVAAVAIVAMWIAGEGASGVPEREVEHAGPESIAAQEAPVETDGVSLRDAELVGESQRAPAVLAGSKRAALPAYFGRVFDTDGSPIPGARVELHEMTPGWHEREPLASAACDAEGRFSIHFDAAGLAPLIARARAPGYRDEPRHPVEPDVELELRIVRATQLRGRVLDSTTRAPIAGAAVALSSIERAVSDASGAYVLEQVAVDRGMTLFVAHEAYVPRQVRVQTAASGASELDVLLDSGVPRTLLVIDRHTDEPIAGAELSAYAGGHVYARSDDQGRVVVRVAAGSELIAEVHADGYFPFQWIWTPESVHGLDPDEIHRIALTRPAWIEGRVTDAAGVPIEGCGVEAWMAETGRTRSTHEPKLPGSAHVLTRVADATGVSDSDGRYRAAVLPSSVQQRVAVVHRDYVPQAPAPILLDAPGERALLDFVLEKGGTIQGRALCNGERARGSIRWERGELSGRARVDEDGGYELCNVAPGDVRVRLHSADSASEYRERSIRVEAGETVTLDFVWNEERAPIRGRVTDASGDAMSGIHVQASCCESPGPWRAFDAETGTDGSYALLVARGDAYRVRAGSHVASRVLEDVAPGTADVDFVLPREGRLALKVVDAATGEPARVSGSQHWALSWRESGGAAFQSLITTGAEPFVDLSGLLELRLPMGRGDLRLWFDADGYRLEELRSVEVGEVPRAEPLVVELERGFELELRFIANHGSAAPPASQGLLFLLEEAERDAVRGPFPEQGGASSHRINGVNVWLGDGGVLHRLVEPDDSGVARMRGLAPGRYVLREFPEELAFEPALIELVDPEDEPRSLVEVRWRRL